MTDFSSCGFGSESRLAPLKIKVLKRFFKQCRRRAIFGSTKNHSVKGSLKNISFLPFYNRRNLLSPQRSFCETEILQMLKFFMEPFRQRGSSMAS